MKKILITWWSWFIWSNLAKQLLNNWNKIFILDNLFTWSKKNISNIINNPNVTFIFHDITTPFWWQFDEIYHLACPASPIHYQKNPVDTIKTTTIWTINMLELATKTWAKILISSTSEVYWDPKIHPQPETYWWNVNPIWPRSCYDEWKRITETLSINYNKQFWTKIKIIRIFNTYWPNMSTDDWRVISNFIVQSIKNEDITIYWNWSQTRSFQYIDDLINWMIKFMENTDDKTIWPINLWNPNEYTIKEISNIILNLITESKSNIIYKNLPIDDPKKRKPDIRLAKKILWWEPKINIEEWLKKTIKYFKWL